MGNGCGCHLGPGKTIMPSISQEKLSRNAEKTA